MLNGRGERRSLTDIFATTTQGLPPAGSGECCAPKLLQYAFANGLRPLQIAEFWQGRSPRMEIRHEGQFYTACRGKCKPILEWMLGGIAVEKKARKEEEDVAIVYADDAVMVIDKPSGLLSVPGLTGEPSVESLLRQRCGAVYMVHRLDRDTSGLMVVARTPEAHLCLQRQFLGRTVRKEYIALLEGEVADSGTISLALRPDLLDRPRQLADPDGGREAVTDYEVLGLRADGRTRVRLTPHTGRTHQLRVHCAHAAGLGTPIVGDALYGRPSDAQNVDAERLCLHAARLEFDHPATQRRLVFTSPPDF